MLSEVKSTIWGSNVSQGYQAACFKVRDVELVKNLSAIGIVLKYRAGLHTVTRNTEQVTSKGEHEQEEPETQLEGFKAVSILKVRATALT